MTNYVRAQFCVEHPLRQNQFGRLLRALDRLGCACSDAEQSTVDGWLEPDNYLLAVKAPARVDRSFPFGWQQPAARLAAPGFARIALSWRVEGRQVQAGLEAWHGLSDSRGRISFNVGEAAFLEGAIEFAPGAKDHVFSAFKQIVVELVAHIRPLIGAIDYEADLLCETLSQTRSLVSWGNFFSRAWLEWWSAEDVQTLCHAVDEWLEVDDLGVLTFIHPLAANQAWTARHQQVDALLRRNPFDEDTRSCRPK